MSFRIVLTLAIMLFYSSAFAGALDRSGQPLNALFHKGGYAEFSFGSVDFAATVGNPWRSDSI